MAAVQTEGETMGKHGDHILEAHERDTRRRLDIGEGIAALVLLVVGLPLLAWARLEARRNDKRS